MLVCVFLCMFAHETAGAARTRHSLRPLLLGRKFSLTTRALRAAGMRRCVWSSLRANGSRECAPDDRLREAIHLAAQRKNGLLRRCAPRNDVERVWAPFNTP